MKEGKFKCDLCKGVFDFEDPEVWSDKDAINEKEEIFGGIPLDECGIVCDDCWKEMGFK